MYGGNYFSGFDLEGKNTGEILGKSSELANPPNPHQLLPKKPRPAGEAQAGLVATMHSPNCRRETASQGSGCLRPQQQVFTNPAGPGAWSGISRTSQQRSFPESSRVIKLARPDEKPAGPGCRAAGLPLSACVCMRATRLWPQKQTTCRASPGSTGQLIFPRLTCRKNIFKNRFLKCKVPPNPQGAEPTVSSLCPLPSVGLGGFTWTQHCSDLLSDGRNGWKPFSPSSAKVCNI